MNTGRQLFLLSTFLVLVLVPGACGGGGSGGASDGTIPLSAPSSEVLEGDTLALTAETQVTPLTWLSSDTGVASVDVRGVVLGCREGSVRITVQGPGSELGSLDLRVVADPEFNLSLPEDAKDLVPVVGRENSIPNCDVTLDLKGFGATIRRENFRPYHRLKLPQSGALGEIGKPELPFYTLYFAIPVNAQTMELASWAVTVTREAPRVYEGMRPWPHQPARWTAVDPEADRDVPPFTVDEAFYESERAWPESTHSARAIHVGNLPVLEVKVIPAQYTPATRSLSLFETTRVEVAFDAEGEMRMPRPLGDYKNLQEVSGDALITRIVQNADLLLPVSAGDLLEDLPPLDQKTFQDLPFDMLILTRPSLGVPALRLTEWRQSQGTRVWLEVLDPAMYPDADSILDFIEDLDDRNWVRTTDGFNVRAMRAICLFGDVEHIPTWEGLNLRNESPPADEDDDFRPIVGTDLPYSTLRGIDWMPDVALGRISVDERGQGHAVVDKIVAYESMPAGSHPHHASVWGLFDDRPEQRVILPGTVRFFDGEAFVRGRGTHWLGQLRRGEVIRPWEHVPPRTGEWWARVAEVLDNERIRLEVPWTKAEPADPDLVEHGGGLQVGFQDGQDDWELVKGTERIRHFLRERDVEVEFGYVRADEPVTVPTPTHGFEGDPLHEDLIDYAWDADAAQIIDRWRQGLDGIVLYCGHGRPTGWSNPPFVGGNLVANDIVGGWYPIVISMSCNSGFFDSETDRIWEWDADEGEAVIVETTGTSGYGTHDVSFCEQVVREPNGGGIAAIGGSRGLDGGKNDRLIDGLFSAFYEDYAEGVIPFGFGAWRACDRLGDAVRAGKLTMHSWMLTPRPSGGGGYTDPDDALYPLQAIHLFGDPMLKIRLPDGPGGGG